MVTFGILGDQALAEVDPTHAVAIIHTDFVAQVSILTVLAKVMREAGSGQIVVFSSVAGIRARKANYVTARPRPDWTGSRADSPTRWPAPACACCWCVPDS
ncbi:MAG: hypothetical protein M5U19_20625 [Microthrixaceae bacterium]|nr:hypothetical protein [Microthrixaceae bacterium]